MIDKKIDFIYNNNKYDKIIKKYIMENRIVNNKNNCITKINIFNKIKYL